MNSALLMLLFRQKAELKGCSMSYVIKLGLSTFEIKPYIFNFNTWNDGKCSLYYFFRNKLFHILNRLPIKGQLHALNKIQTHGGKICLSLFWGTAEEHFSPFLARDDSWVREKMAKQIKILLLIAKEHPLFGKIQNWIL